MVKNPIALIDEGLKKVSKATNPPVADILKQKCEAKGWIWDSVNEKCTPPSLEAQQEFNKDQKQIDQQQEPPTPTNTKFNPDGTVTISSNLGTKTISKEEYRKELESKQAGFGYGDPELNKINTSVAVQQQQLDQEQALQMGMQAGQLDEQTLMQQAEAAEVDYVQAFFKAVPSMLPDIAQIVGGAALATFTGGVGAGVGYVGIANGVRGVYSDIIREIEGQKGEFSGSQEEQLEEGKQVLNDILSARNAGALSSSGASAEWNKQLSSIRQSYYNLKRQQIGNKFIGEDLTKEIREFEIYFEGEYVIQYDEFILSLVQPDPTKVNPTDEIKKRILEKIKQQ